MPLPKDRSKTRRKRVRKTSRGRKEIYLKPVKQKVSCAICKVVLAGVGVTGSRTEKSVSRKFGGNICHTCLERIVKESVRVKGGEKSIDAVSFLDKKYIQQLVK